jgi:tartronate-semialdehyde synthase
LFGRKLAPPRILYAAVRVLARESVNAAFGAPGAAINPFYAAVRKRSASKPTAVASPQASRHWDQAKRTLERDQFR